MSDALELAREVVANDARDTWSLASLTLAAAVIAQAEELAKLRALPSQPCDLITQGEYEELVCGHQQSIALSAENTQLRAAVVMTGAEHMGSQILIASLRAALTEALDIAEGSTFKPLPANWSGVITVDSDRPYRDAARLAELRKMVGQ